MLCKQVESHAVAHIGLCLTADGAQAELCTDDFSQERVLQLLQLAQQLNASEAEVEKLEERLAYIAELALKD